MKRAIFAGLLLSTAAAAGGAFPPVNNPCGYRPLSDGGYGFVCASTYVGPFNSQTGANTETGAAGGWILDPACSCLAGLQPSQSFSTDGSSTFCGMTVIKSNSAHDHTALQNVAGQGLVISGDNVGNYITGGHTTDGSNSAPKLDIPIGACLAQEGIAIAWDLPMRFSVWISAVSGNAIGSAYAFAGFEQLSSPTTTTGMTFEGVLVEAAVLNLNIWANGADNSESSNYYTADAGNAYIFEMPLGIQVPIYSYGGTYRGLPDGGQLPDGGAGFWAGAWPGQFDGGWHPLTAYAANANGWQNDSYIPQPSTNYYAVIGAQSFSGSGTYATYVVSGWQVEHMAR